MNHPGAGAMLPPESRNTLEDLFRRLDQLNDVGASLSSEHDLDLLLEKIVLAAKRITRADGGTLYLLSDERSALHFEIVRTDSLNIAFGGSSGQPTSGLSRTWRCIGRTARPTTAWLPPMRRLPATR